jgi:hypothetical protein
LLRACLQSGLLHGCSRERGGVEKPRHPPAAPLPPSISRGNPTYATPRARLPPLDRAAADGLPSVPNTTAYAFARSRGVAAFGGYSFETQSGCKCSPWSWVFYDPATGKPNGTYIGCADPDPVRLPFGAWCPVDPRECPSYYSSFVAGNPRAASGGLVTGKMVYYDYCGPVRERTTAGCLCQVRACVLGGKGDGGPEVTASAPRRGRQGCSLRSRRASVLPSSRSPSTSSASCRAPATLPSTPAQGIWYDNNSIAHAGTCAIAKHWEAK